MNEAKQRLVLARRQQEFDAWSRVNSVSLRGFRPGRGGDTLGDSDLFLKELVESLDTPVGKVIVLGLVSTMLLTACAPGGTIPTSAGEIQPPGVTVIAPDHTPGLTAITAGPEQPALTPIATLGSTEAPRQPATQEAMFIANLPGIMSGMGGAGNELRFQSNPAFADRLTDGYIVLTGRLDGGGMQETMTNLAGISLCQNDGCFSFSAAFPEKMLGADGLEYSYIPAKSQDGLVVYTAKIPGSAEGEENVLAFVNRFPDRTGEGLFPVTAVDRDNGELLLLWVDNNSRVVERVNHVRTIRPGETTSVDLDAGKVGIGNETIDIGAPPRPSPTAMPTEKPTAVVRPSPEPSPVPPSSTPVVVPSETSVPSEETPPAWMPEGSYYIGDGHWATRSFFYNPCPTLPQEDWAVINQPYLPDHPELPWGQTKYTCAANRERWTIGFEVHYAPRPNPSP